MKRLILLLLSGLVLINCQNARTKQPWQTLTVKEAGFQIDCPIKSETDDIIEHKFDKHYKNVVLNCWFDDVRYSLHTMNWDEEKDSDENEKAFWDTLLARGIGGRETITIKNGLKISDRFDKGFRTISRTILIDGIAYFFRVEFAEQKSKADFNSMEIEQAEKFLNSFKLLNSQKITSKLNP